ncbi:MAG: sensor histidine kinase [Gallionella sp.]|nr:MAG: sensor histidine kinase [Gallionella sp.]
MKMARSIKQNTPSDALPNFRNLGVTLRILLISNGLALLQAILLAGAPADVPLQMMQIIMLLAPVLLAGLLLLWAAQPWLDRLAYRHGVLAVNALVAILTLAAYSSGSGLYGGDGNYFDAARYVLFGAMVCNIVLMYFRLRSRLLSHALHDARLQVLRARIRPHFLFNTLNAVLGIVRAQPKLAETALEDMADLFRMAMSDVQDFVLLRHEIQLCKQYIALEQLRMGERLHVDWQIQDIPNDALIPPLLLQPLLENAVYHGIEPLPQGGSIGIAVRRDGNELQIKVDNPRTPRGDDALHTGNKMALQNIRERLELLFDVEARYEVESGKDFYHVEITLPYMKERAA